MTMPDDQAGASPISACDAGLLSSVGYQWQRTGEHADQADDRQRVAAVPRASWRSATAATTPHAAALVPTLQAVRLVQRQVAVTHGRARARGQTYPAGWLWQRIWQFGRRVVSTHRSMDFHASARSRVSHAGFASVSERTNGSEGG